MQALYLPTALCVSNLSEQPECCFKLLEESKDLLKEGKNCLPDLLEEAKLGLYGICINDIILSGIYINRRNVIGIGSTAGALTLVEAMTLCTTLGCATYGTSLGVSTGCILHAVTLCTTLGCTTYGAGLRISTGSIGHAVAVCCAIGLFTYGAGLGRSTGCLTTLVSSLIGCCLTAVALIPVAICIILKKSEVTLMTESSLNYVAAVKTVLCTLLGGSICVGVVRKNGILCTAGAGVSVTINTLVAPSGLIEAVVNGRNNLCVAMATRGAGVGSKTCFGTGRSLDVGLIRMLTGYGKLGSRGKNLVTAGALSALGVTGFLTVGSLACNSLGVVVLCPGVGAVIKDDTVICGNKEVSGLNALVSTVGTNRNLVMEDNAEVTCRKLNLVYIGCALYKSHSNAGPSVVNIVSIPSIALNESPACSILEIKNGGLGGIKSACRANTAERCVKGRRSGVGLAALGAGLGRGTGCVSPLMLANCAFGYGYLGTFKSNGYGSTVSSYGISKVSFRICSGPFVVASNLKKIRACFNIAVYLSIYAVFIGHIVCSIAGIPLCAKVSTVTCNGKGSLTVTSGTHVLCIIVVSESRNYRVTASITSLSSCTGCRGTKAGVCTGVAIGAPGSATLIPCVFCYGVAVACTVINKV